MKVSGKENWFKLTATFYDAKGISHNEQRTMGRMSQMRIYAIILSAVLMAGCNDANRMIADHTSAGELSLWYNEPADLAKWEQALPIGNGRLGAMVFGGVQKERIQFNCDTLFTGKPHDYAHKGAVEYLTPIRKLLFDGKQKEAHDLANREFMSVLDDGSNGQRPYQPFGDLILTFPEFDDKTIVGYRRQLDIDSAVASLEFQPSG